VSAALLGMTIRSKRQSNGWSQEELAKRIGGVADQAAISRLENGLVADPGSKMMFHLAQALAMSTDDLLGLLCQGEDEPGIVEVRAEVPDRAAELANVKSQVHKLLARVEELEHH
jgi:transcriptional regulator with XRE-family HTH domain